MLSGPQLMVLTYTYLVIAAMVGAAVFIHLRPHLTTAEKKRYLACAIGACPIVTVLAYLVLSSVHHEAYRVNEIAGPETGRTFGLALFLGLLVSVVFLWRASQLGSLRTYEQYVQRQRDEERARERARIEAQEREERIIEGKTILAKLEAQKSYLELQRQEAKAEADQKHYNQMQAKDRLLLAFKRFVSNENPMMDKDDDALKAEFRSAVRKPRILPAKDLHALNDSDDPQVRDLLHGRPNISLTD